MQLTDAEIEELSEAEKKATPDFTAEDFSGIKMPMTNGRITTDILRLDEAIMLMNRLVKERYPARNKMRSLLDEVKASRQSYVLATQPMSIDPSNETVGNLSHFCCGWAVTLSIVVIPHSAHYLWPWLPIGVLVAAFKEFVWDIWIESPAVSGLWKGGWEDFCGYLAGAVWGLGILWLGGWFR